MSDRVRITDYLEGLPEETFSGEVYRAARFGRDPTAPSTNGGRWASSGGPAVLYTSFEREGAIAELSFHLGQLDPVPSKPIQIARLNVGTDRTLRLVRADFPALGIDEVLAREPNYNKTQLVGDVVEWLGLDGLIVPSARWETDNLMLFTGNRRPELSLEIVNVEEFAWQDWAVEHGFVEPDRWPRKKPGD